MMQRICRYTLMRSCWNENPLMRPSFADIVDQLEYFLREVKVSEIEFRQFLSHSFHSFRFLPIKQYINLISFDYIKKIKSLKWVDFALIWEESFEINGSGDKYWNTFHCTNGELYPLYLNCFQKKDNTSESIAEIKGRSNYHGSNGVPLLAL